MFGVSRSGFSGVHVRGSGFSGFAVFGDDISFPRDAVFAADILIGREVVFVDDIYFARDAIFAAEFLIGREEVCGISRFQVSGFWFRGFAIRGVGFEVSRFGV